MPWEGSTRKDRLPPEWQELRALILRRCGGRCEARMLNGARCPDKATDVDHIVPGDDHHPDNLQGLCRWHHARKSSAEGNAARPRFSARRRPEPPPGVLP